MIKSPICKDLIMVNYKKRQPGNLRQLELNTKKDADGILVIHLLLIDSDDFITHLGKAIDDRANMIFT